MLGHRWDSSPKIRFAPDSPLEQRKFELLVAREDGWPVLTTLIDLKALLLHENQATFSREGPTVRISFPPAASPFLNSDEELLKTWTVIIH